MIKLVLYSTTLEQEKSPLQPVYGPQERLAIIIHTCMAKTRKRLE